MTEHLERTTKNVSVASVNEQSSTSDRSSSGTIDAAGVDADRGFWYKPSGRRTFLRWFVGIGTVSVGGLLSIPLVRFALDPLTRTTTETAWTDLGSESDFTETSVPQKRTISIIQTDGWRKVLSEKPVYVVKKADGKLVVLTSICPHLGCSVKWVDTDNHFKCPCHNGIFAPEGKLTSGPPPRDMDALDSRIADGHLQVRYQSFRQLVKTKEVLA